MKEQEIKDFIIREIEYQLKNIDNLQKKDIIILLKNYTKYKKKLESLKVEVENINIKSFKCNTKLNEDFVQSSKVFKDPLTITEDKIEDLKQKIECYTYLVRKLDLALSLIESSEYHSIIKNRYILKLSVSEILLKMAISESTYKRHHNKLLNEIKSILIV